MYVSWFSQKYHGIMLIMGETLRGIQELSIIFLQLFCEFLKLFQNVKLSFKKICNKKGFSAFFFQNASAYIF